MLYECDDIYVHRECFINNVTHSYNNVSLHMNIITVISVYDQYCLVTTRHTVTICHIK
jgi:hypothetical protein